MSWVNSRQRRSWKEYPTTARLRRLIIADPTFDSERGEYIERVHTRTQYNELLEVQPLEVILESVMVGARAHLASACRNSIVPPPVALDFFTVGTPNAGKEVEGKLAVVLTSVPPEVVLRNSKTEFASSRKVNPNVGREIVRSDTLAEVYHPLTHNIVREHGIRVFTTQSKGGHTNVINITKAINVSVYCTLVRDKYMLTVHPSVSRQHRWA